MGFAWLPIQNLNPVAAGGERVRLARSTERGNGLRSLFLKKARVDFVAGALPQCAENADRHLDSTSRGNSHREGLGRRFVERKRYCELFG
jgi:hypothetical protein